MDYWYGLRDTEKKVIKNKNSIRRIIYFSLSLLFIFFVGIFSAQSQQMPKMKTDTSSVKKENMKDGQQQTMLPMPFFTHMGIPYNVGTYGLRLAVLPTLNDGKENTEFNFQLETGLSKTVGLFIGGEGLFDDPTLETMFQFLVWKSKNGMNGFSPIIEFEFPLGKESTRSVYTLVGIASTFSNSHVAFNQVLHYSPLEDLAEGSVSMLVKVSKQIFLVSEISGVTEKGARPIFNLLGGIKFQLNKNFLIGFAYQLPLTTNRDYSSRYVFQPNMVFQK